MAEDHRDKIEQIRARRGRDNVQIGYNPYDPQQQQVGGPQTTGVQEIGIEDGGAALLGADFKSPWLRDRVTLSLEGQIAMIEQRAHARVGMADLGYSNRISILPLRPGMYVKIEPPGTYRLTYHNR